MKKGLLTGILMFIFLVLCVSMVSATVSITNTFNEETPTIGNSNQAASNPRADDNDEEDIYANSVNIVLENNNATAVSVTNIQFTYDQGFSENEVDLNVSGTMPTGITNTSSGTLVLRGRIPKDLDAVETDDDDSNYLEPRAFRVATAVITLSDGNTLSMPVYMQRENQLLFNNDRVYVSINEGSDDRVQDDSATEEIRPGDDIQIKAEAENDYSKSDNLEIDGTFRVLLDDDTDSGWDWDSIDEEEDFTVEENTDDEAVEVEFTVDKDVDNNGEYDMYLYLTGEDDNGAEHGAKIRIDFNVERKKYDFIVKKAELRSTVLTCTRDTSVDVRIESIGSRGDDEISIYIESLALGINTNKQSIEMDGYGDSDDSYSRTFPINIPEDTPAGTYTIRVKVFYSGDKNDGVHADEKDIEITIGDCAAQEEETEDEEETADETAEDEFDDTIPDYILQDFGITESVETSFKDSVAYIVLLVIAILAAIGSTTLLIVLFVRR